MRTFCSLFSGFLLASVLIFGFLPVDTDEDASDEVAVKVANSEFSEAKIPDTLASGCTIGTWAIAGTSPLVSNILDCPDGQKEKNTCEGSPCSHCDYQENFGCECKDFDDENHCNHTVSCVPEEEDES